MVNNYFTFSFFLLVDFMSLETFADFDFSDNIKKSIEEMGFKNPTQIQKIAIPEALNGKDLIAQAQTGSGKTLAYSIPLVEKLFLQDKSPQAIVICPTRELSIQVSKEISKIASNTKKVKILPVYGGESIGKQTRVLKKGVHIIVGTPGRIIDHINSGHLDLNGVETVILDEADEMLDMGFRGDIETILEKTPKQRQTLLFSATIPEEVKKIAKKYQNDPKFLKSSKKQRTPNNITQYYFETTQKDKLDLLTFLIEKYNFKSAIVFANTKKRVRFINHYLQDHGYLSEALNSDISQKERDKIMNKFRNGNIKILVATDLASRGLDIADIGGIFNYDIPQTPDDYIHRIGRTGRAGKDGYAFTFIEPKEKRGLLDIQKVIKSKIKKQKNPL